MEKIYVLLSAIIIILQIVMLLDRLPRKTALLMSEGRLLTDNMKRCGVSLGDIMSAARRQGYFNIADIDTAFLERNGEISLLPVPAKRCLNPRDFNFAPVREGMAYVVFENGRFNEENLRKVSFTRRTLTDFLIERGYETDKLQLITVSESGRVDVFER